LTSGAADIAVVVDVQALQNPLHRDRGIGRYVVEHVEALLDVDAPVDALVLNPLGDVPPVPTRWVERGLVRWNHPAVVRRAHASGRTVVYHVPSPFEPAVPEDGVVVHHALRGADVLSVMLHDAIPFRFPEWYQRDESTRRFFRCRAALARRADVVVTNSACTADDAVELLGIERARIVVQGTGAPSFVTRPGRPAAIPSAIRRPYVLTVTGWGDPRKDLGTTLRAFGALDAPLRAGHQLVVACALPPEGRAAWSADARAAGLGEDDLVVAETRGSCVGRPGGATFGRDRKSVV